MQEPSMQVHSPAFRQVQSGRGSEWWSSAWRLLFHRGAAAVWIVMCLIAIIILTVLHVVPLLGSIAAQVGWFVFAGGLMLAARKTEQGAAPQVADLFAGFGPQLGPLVIAGVLVVIGVLLVAGAAAVAGLGALGGAVLGALNGDLALLAGLGVASAAVALVALLLLIPIFMAGWLAPALIVFRQQPPVDALKASLGACWSNVGALTVYGLLWIAFAIIASIPLMLGWLVLAPLMVLSTYTAYCDLFDEVGS
jgi:uncharacterized membrane protein